jgi:hypothetical protein
MAGCQQAAAHCELVKLPHTPTHSHTLPHTPTHSHTLPHTPTHSHTRTHTHSHALTPAGHVLAAERNHCNGQLHHQQVHLRQRPLGSPTPSGCPWGCSRPTYPSPSSTHRQFTGGREFFFSSTTAPGCAPPTPPWRSPTACRSQPHQGTACWQVSVASSCSAAARGPLVALLGCCW